MNSNIPVIDVSKFVNGDYNDKAEISKIVDIACQNYGFLIISGHGIDRGLLLDMGNVSKKFFSMPQQFKFNYLRPHPEEVRGYSPLSDEGLSYSLDVPSPPDLKESFSIGPIATDKKNVYFSKKEAYPHFADNIYPDIDLFKEIWNSYYHEMDCLASQLMQIFAWSLSLDENYFMPFIDKNISMLRVINYPSVHKDEIMCNQLRAGAHSDYGSLTIVYVDDEEDFYGLQIYNNGEWYDVPNINNTFIVNIGDLMMQWTNDRWKSTLHRVINATSYSKKMKERMSFVFFHQPNYDALIECLHSCEDGLGKKMYNPITSGEHLTNKFIKQTTKHNKD